MRHLLSLRLTFVLSTLLCILPITAYAKFIIEFSDGHRMTISNYEEQGEMLKVYTSLGSFSFHRADVVQITKTDDGKQAKKSTVTTKPLLTRTLEKESMEILPGDGSVSPRDQEPLRPSSPLQDLASKIEDGLFRMRYIFALAIGIKALKLFFAASVR